MRVLTDPNVSRPMLQLAIGIANGSKAPSGSRLHRADSIVLNQNFVPGWQIRWPVGGVRVDSFINRIVYASAVIDPAGLADGHIPAEQRPASRPVAPFG